MRISIAMATYNGGKYIREQLDSFVRQTRLPDELVVHDDCSWDSTLQIVDEFAKSAPFPVRIFQNEKNVGYAKNFDLAIQNCREDIIFLSDQDDIWFPTKIERIALEFGTHPELFVVINDAEIVDHDLLATGLTKCGQTRALGLSQEDFITGCCTALRSAIKPLINPIPIDEFVHDTWLHAVASRLGIRSVLPDTLQFYRRHGENVSQALSSCKNELGKRDLIRAYGVVDSRPWCRKRIQRLMLLRARIESVVDAPLCISERVPEALRSIDNERAAVEARLSMLEKARFARWLPAMAMYLRGQYTPFQGWKSLVKDLLRA